MTPQDFITKWGPGGSAFALNEEQGAQSHFIDLCDLLGVPKPGSEDGYVFEKQTLVLGEARGYADVFRRGAFAWENKAPGKNLDSALKQLLNYSSALSNPPILVVCDRLQIRVQTQFTGHPTEKFTVLLAELDQPDKRAKLRRIWQDPESFRPKITTRDITEKAAKSFATLAEQMRNARHDPQKVSHFLTQCLFCFFAEDVGLLPNRMFDALLNNRNRTSDGLTDGIASLFQVMQRGGAYGNDDIPFFNGGLFQTIDVPKLDIMNVSELRNAAALNWSAIDVSIFGTLFERGLDPAKRSQLGAHYTDPATIQRIIEPVLQRPLLQIWELLAPELIGLLAKSKSKNDANYKLAYAKFSNWLEQLKNYRVLDPACGSGNFLFLGLKALKDIEHKSHLEAAAMGLDREADLVTGPHNMLGIELNEYAAELARVTVWIGELQWRMSKGYEFKKNPVLDPLDNIECRDALLTFVPADVGSGAEGAGRAAGRMPAAHTLRSLKSPPASAPLPDPLASGSGGLKAVEAAWPKASIVIGNPPFLGGSKKRRELGDAYFDALDTVFTGRVPGGADLVCYWLDKGRKQIQYEGVGAVGFVATNSIRGGANQFVLKGICNTTNIFNAWSDQGWVNDGAAVRVSLVCFGAVFDAVLDGVAVSTIHADLTAGVGLNLTQAVVLKSNTNASFQGSQKIGGFDISGELARTWLKLPNPNGRSNCEVLKPSWNGLDVTRRPRDGWIIDFGIRMSEPDASLYETPFEHVARFVKTERELNNREAYKRYWWRHGEPRVAMRSALNAIPRYFALSAVTKHIYWRWLSSAVLPDKALIVVTRADDTTFGILHSRFHELWSLRMGTSLEDRPRYTPTTCFETFPFPAGLTPQDTASQQTEALPDGSVIPAALVPGVHAAAQAIAKAAKYLNTLRENWLNPPDWTDRIPEFTPLGMTSSPYPDRIVAKPGHEKELLERTLTKLYNLRPAWLAAAHQQLDAKVAEAYGWADYTADMLDEEILKRLLALNLARVAE